MTGRARARNAGRPRFGEPEPGRGWGQPASSDPGRDRAGRDVPTPGAVSSRKGESSYLPNTTLSGSWWPCRAFRAGCGERTELSGSPCCFHPRPTGGGSGAWSLAGSGLRAWAEEPGEMGSYRSAALTRDDRPRRGQMDKLRLCNERSGPVTSAPRPGPRPQKTQNGPRPLASTDNKPEIARQARTHNGRLTAHAEIRHMSASPTGRPGKKTTSPRSLCRGRGTRIRWLQKRREWRGRGAWRERQAGGPSGPGHRHARPGRRTATQPRDRSRLSGGQECSGSDVKGDRVQTTRHTERGTW